MFSLLVHFIPFLGLAFFNVQPISIKKLYQRQSCFESKQKPDSSSLVALSKNWMQSAFKWNCKQSAKTLCTPVQLAGNSWNPEGLYQEKESDQQRQKRTLPQ